MPRDRDVVAPVKPKPIEHSDRGMVAPAKPVFVAPPPGKPQPALQKIGYWGSIEEFNNRTAEAVRAHTAVKGFSPSPGLTLDLARSPIPVTQFEDMFKSSGSQIAANDRALKTDQQQNPHDYFFTRPDGVIEQHSPLTKMLGMLPPLPADHPVHRTLAQLQKQYPNVPQQQGFLPIPHADQLYKAMTYLDSHGGLQGALDKNGMTLDQYSQQVKRSRGGASELAAAAALQSHLGPVDPNSPEAGKAKTVPLTSAGVDLVQAKTELSKVMGTPLSEGGFFTSDDAKKLNLWMKSASYFRKVTEFQAKEKGLSVQQYMTAWKRQQSGMQKHGFAAHFLGLIPLQVFAGAGATGHWLFLSGGDPISSAANFPVHSASLVLGGVGGTVVQLKADVGAAGQFVNSISPTSLNGKGKSYDESKQAAAEQLRKNPSWARVFFPDAPDNELTKVLDVVGDIVLLRKATFTGERAGAGLIGEVAKTDRFTHGTHYAFLDLASKDASKLDSAASALGGTPGAHKLVTFTAPLIKSGKMTIEQFRAHAQEMYETGTTIISIGDKDRTIIGSILTDLRTDKLPSPGLAGRAWLTSRRGMRSTLDSLDSSLRKNPAVGGKVGAVIGTLRSAVAHPAGKGTLALYEKNLSEVVYNFINKHKLGDRALADKYASDIVRFQSKDNTPGLVNVNLRLNRLYHGKYSDVGENTPYSETEFNPLLGVEGPTSFVFPSGGDRPVQGSMLDKSFQNIDYYHRHASQWFNNFARQRSRFILGSGLSLFWKHAIGGDPARVAAGGGLFARGKEIDQAMKDIDALARGNVAIERKLGMFYKRSKQGEANYMLGDGAGSRAVPAFHTGDHFDNSAMMTGAGAKLRALVLDDSLAAYQQGTLVNLVRHNKLIRKMFHSAQKSEPELTMEDYANRIHGRYASVEDAANAAGVDNVFDRAAQVVAENRGAGVDKALGEFIKENKLDFGVDSARADTARGIDKVTGAAVGKIMTPNKFWRERFAKNILHKTFAEMTAAGLGHEEALAIAMDQSSEMLKYHMLDFANRLQIEQDYRYVSWFFTKHRLYWKWLIGTFVRHPGYAATVVDARKLLDDQGNIPLPFDVPFFGKMVVPVARLFWIPNQDYPAISPDTQFFINLFKNGGNPEDAWSQVQTSGVGNSFTRVDTALKLFNKAARDHTYSSAIRGLPPKVQHRLNRSFNEYQLTYFAEHGHYDMNESHVVSQVMWHATGEEAWRSILPLPVVQQFNPNEQQKLLDQYMMIVDPRKRQDFLVKHEDLAAQFGIYEDPKKFLHNQQFFGKYLPALDAYRAVRSDILARIQKEGYTSALQLERKRTDKAFQKTFTDLLRLDARSAGIRVGDTDIPGATGVPLGPWGKLVSTDPQIDPTHMLNGLFPGGVKTQDYSKVYGRLQETLKKELANMNDPTYAATYADDPGELKIRRGQILQQLDAFKSYPKDALGVTTAKYQEKYVNPYWSHIDKEKARIYGVAGTSAQGLPQGERDQAAADLRVWRDKHDKPVVVDGVSFPSPIRVAWQGLEPGVKHQRLAYFASKGWDHLSDYEKELLGRKPDGKFSEGWAKLEETYTAAADQLHVQGHNMPKNYKLVLAKWVNQHIPGFLNDYNFAQKPLYQRLSLTTIVQHSKYKAQWQGLFAAADSYQKYLNSGNYSKTSVRALWKANVKSPAFQQKLDSVPGFKAELADFGPDLLNGLIG